MIVVHCCVRRPLDVFIRGLFTWADRLKRCVVQEMIEHVIELSKFQLRKNETEKQFRTIQSTQSVDGSRIGKRKFMWSTLHGMKFFVMLNISRTHTHAFRRAASLPRQIINQSSATAHDTAKQELGAHRHACASTITQHSQRAPTSQDSPSTPRAFLADAFDVVDAVQGSRPLCSCSCKPPTQAPDQALRCFLTAASSHGATSRLSRSVYETKSKSASLITIGGVVTSSPSSSCTPNESPE